MYRKKTIYISLSIVIAIIILWTSFLWKMFSCGFAGSYPFVEYWDLKVSENNLIEIIEDVKREHPELRPPDTTFKDEKVSYWYHTLFYYSDTKEVVDTWTRPEIDSSITTFAFVGLSENKNNLKEINRDFGYFANKKQIWKFKNRILELVKQKIKQRQQSSTAR